MRTFVADPRSISLALLAAYLVATVAMLAGHSDDRGLAVAHLVLVASIVWTLRGRGEFARRVGDLLPLIAAPALYAEIPALIAVAKNSYNDATIQAIELHVFGAHPSQMFAAIAPSLPLSELLHAGYLAYYPAIFVPPLLLLVRGQRRGYLETVAALTTTYLVCWVIFVLYPVEGPRYEWGPAAAAPHGPMRNLANAVLSAGSSRGAAFPSSHMAVMVAQSIAALRWQRRTGVIVSVIAMLVGFGAVYGGFHYATDIVAGALLGAVVAGVSVWVFSKSRDGAEQ